MVKMVCVSRCLKNEECPNMSENLWQKVYTMLCQSKACLAGMVLPWVEMDEQDGMTYVQCKHLRSVSHYYTLIIYLYNYIYEYDYCI